MPVLATSDDEGRLHAAVTIAPLPGTRHRPGGIDGFLYAEGYAREKVWHRLDPGERLDLGEIQLSPGYSIHGRVETTEGKAAVGAVVNLIRSQQVLGNRVLASATTDADGTFRILGAPLEAGKLRASHEGHEGEAVELPEPRAGVVLERDLLLVPKEPLYPTAVGQVLDVDGQPVPGARVSGVYTSDFYGDGTTADADGRFRLEWKLAERFRDSLHDDPADLVPAKLLAYGPSREGYPAEVPFVAGQEHTLRLKAPRWLEVRLIDGDGSPIPWGHVQARESRPRIPTTALGREGRARVLLPLEPFAIEGLAPGYRTSSFGPFDPVALDGTLELTLAPGQAVRGNVLFRDSPVVGASIFVNPCQAPDQPRISAPPGGTVDRPFDTFGSVYLGSHDASTDGQGAFVATLPGDGWHSLGVEAEGHAVAVFGPYDWDPSAGVHEVRIELRDSGALEGRVIPEAGQEAAGQLVAVSNGWGRAWITEADERGAYRLEGLPPGDWQVRPAAPPVGSTAKLSGLPAPEGHETRWDARVPPGGTAYADLDLRASGACRLQGRLLLNGQPRGGWEAALLFADGGHARLAETVTDTDGRFELATTHPGRRRLLFATGHIALPQGKKTLIEEIDLVEGLQRWERDLSAGELSLRVDDVGLDSHLMLRVTVKNLGEGPLEVEAEDWVSLADLQEGMSFPDLPAGEYRVRVFPTRALKGADWPDPDHRTVTLRAGEITEPAFP